MRSGELANYRDYLDHYRGVIARQCADLSPEQLATRAAAPSTLSLLGLLRHVAMVEQTWFARALQGTTDEPRLFRGTADPDEEFNAITGTQAEVDEAYALWRRQVERADAWLATQSDETMADEVVFNRDGRIASKRQVLLHLIEEYARHAGHGDLLRERIDGRTGL